MKQHQVEGSSLLGRQFLFEAVETGMLDRVEALEM
jgi:hypothetical protein